MIRKDGSGSCPGLFAFLVEPNTSGRQARQPSEIVLASVIVPNLRCIHRSAREGLPGLRFNPLVLVGPPGIGKSHWARRLAQHLAVPATKIEATGEQGSFSLVGTQKGWSTASRDIRGMTDRDMKQISDRLNHTPRKCLGWKTPAEVFREKMVEEMQ